MMKKETTFTASQIIAFAVLLMYFASSVCSAAHPPACSSIPHGQSCSLDSNAETVTVLDNMVLVGAANHLYSFGRDLSIERSVAMDPQSEKYDRCTSFDQAQGGLSNEESECQNFIRVIQQVPSGYETNAVDQRQVMVCGTNAFFPKCTIHETSMLQNYSYMTSEEDDEGYSPHSNEDPIVAVLTSNGRFFSATHFTAFQPHRTIGMSRGPLSGDSQFRVRAPISDPLWFHKPEFISTYEINDHVYFFIREPAFEVDNGNSIVYSRAIRICKNDEGQAANIDGTPFLTYQKARMVCSYGGERASIPYNYDNLESTFLWNGGNGGALTLYAVFSSPDNGPQGSAICKFSFDPNIDGSLTRVFENGRYTVPVMQNGQQVWVTEEQGPFSCPGSTDNPQRTVEQANRYQLVDSPVQASDPEPLYVVSGVKLDKIAADVITFNGQEQEIVYFTTEDGELRQAVNTPGSGTQEHLIQDVGSAVSYLSVHRNAADETRQVYVTTEDRIMTISRGDCSQYTSCFKCLDSKDAYCGWTANGCVNKLRQNPQDLIEAHLASEEQTVALCGTRPPVSNPPPVDSTNPCPFPSRLSSSGVCEPEQDGLSGDRNSSKSEMNVPTIVGATVGAFVLGVPVGAFVCFIFFRMFVRPRQSKNYNLEEENHVTMQSNSNGISRMSNIPNGESGDLSTRDLQKKADLSLSVDVGPAPSLRQPGPPRYVDVATPSKSQLSSSVPVGSNGSALPTSMGIEMMYKHNSCADIHVNGGMLSKKECSFGGSENDLVPPLVHLAGNEGYGTHKKSSKQTKFAMPPTGANGVSRTQVPGYKVPKGRTPSTTWLRENSISECSDLSSPLQSPISDV